MEFQFSTLLRQILEDAHPPLLFIHHITSVGSFVIHMEIPSWADEGRIKRRNFNNITIGQIEDNQSDRSDEGWGWGMGKARYNLPRLIRCVVRSENLVSASLPASINKMKGRNPLTEANPPPRFPPSHLPASLEAFIAIFYDSSTCQGHFAIRFEHFEEFQLKTVWTPSVWIWRDFR